MSIRIYFSSTQSDVFTAVKKAVAESTPLLIECGVDPDYNKWLNIFWDKEPGMHSATAIRWNDESDIDGFIEYLEKTFGFPRVDDFSKMEKIALNNCIDYINRCSSYGGDEGGYKECVRDAFTPFVQKHRLESIGRVDQYYLDIIDGVDYVKQVILDGVKGGLRSVYAA